MVKVIIKENSGEKSRFPGAAAAVRWCTVVQHRASYTSLITFHLVLVIKVLVCL